MQKISRFVFVCCLIMILAVLPGAAFADDGGTLGRGSGGQLYWFFRSSDGLLTIRPLSSAGWEGGDSDTGNAELGLDNHENYSSKESWPWNKYRSQIKQVRTLGSIEVKEGISLRNMFADCKNLTNVDLHGLKTNGVISFDRMFYGCESLEEIDLSKFENDRYVYEMNNMFAGCKNLRKVTLNNSKFISRSSDASGNSGGVNMVNMFKDCVNLKEVDMSNITIYGRDSWNQFNSMFKGLSNLESVKLINTRVPNMKNFSSMFEDCSNLTNVDLTGFIPSAAVNLDRMFYNCSKLENLDISSFGRLDHIESMQDFLTSCSNLKMLNMDNLDNSHIDETTNEGYARVWGAEGLTSLQTLSAKNSKIWMVKAKTKSTGDHPYWAATGEDQNGNIPYIMGSKMNFDPDVVNGENTILLNKREWIDLLTDRWKVTKGSENFDGNKEGPDWKTNPNVAKNIDDLLGDNIHTNSNGVGFLAPGVYTRTDEVKDYFPVLPDTYYRVGQDNPLLISDQKPIVSIAGTDYFTKSDGVYDVGDTDLVVIVSGGTVHINSKTKTKSDLPGTNNATELTLPNDGIQITYKEAARDIVGDPKDVRVTIKSIKFTKQDLIPTIETYQFSGCESDPENKSCDPNQGHVIKEYWFRQLFSISQVELAFKDYLRIPENESAEGQKNNGYALSSGSGSEVEFTIEIIDDDWKDQVQDPRSFLFFVDDLDVAASQTWDRETDGTVYIAGDDHKSLDRLPWDEWNNDPAYGVTYGSGSESIVLGNGNDLNYITLANHTGLEVMNGNEIIPTGHDQTTAWSSVYVRADAAGSEYTWKNGVGCTTYLLKATKPLEELDPVYVLPELRKTINGIAPSGDYDRFFKFTMKTVHDDFADLQVGSETDKKEITHYSDGQAPSLGSTRENTGDVVYFGYLKFDVPKESPYKKAYIYKITEENDAAHTEIDYDDSVFYMQIIVSAPASEMELKKGTKAEIYYGEKRGDNDIVWDETPVVIYSYNIQPALDRNGTPKTKVVRDGEKPRAIFTDPNGTEFFRFEGKYKTPDDETVDLIPTAADKGKVKKVSYEGKEYEVYVDQNGVEYIHVENGSQDEYRTPYGQFLIPAVIGDVYVQDHDEEVMEAQKVNGHYIFIDIHNVKYIKVDGKYYDPDDPETEIEVKDGSFNPYSTDRVSYEHKYVTYNGEIYPVFVDVNGIEYYKRDAKYYDTTDLTQELENRVPGTVDPTVNDQKIYDKRVEEVIDREVYSGNDYPLQKSKDIKTEDGKVISGIVYYYDAENHNYHSRIGTVLEESEYFKPDKDSDEKVMVREDIRIDPVTGVRFYRLNQKYYVYEDHTDSSGNAYEKDSAYQLSENVLDVNDITVSGSFANKVETADIIVKKITDLAKDGVFEFSIKFDTAFDPSKEFVFKPSEHPLDDVANDDDRNTIHKADNWSETNNSWTFKLHEGQQLTIRNVPLNTTYTLKEVITNNGFNFIKTVNPDGDSKSFTVEKKITQADSSQYTHEFHNQLTEVILRKVFDGSNKNRQFRIQVIGTIDNLDANQIVNYGYMDGDQVRRPMQVMADSGGRAQTSAENGGVLSRLFMDCDDIALFVPLGSTVEIMEDKEEHILTSIKTTVNDAKIEDTDKGKKITFKVTEDKKEVTFVNTSETMPISGEKHWEHQGNQEKPESFTVILYKVVENYRIEVARETFTKDNVEIDPNDENIWRFTFTNEYQRFENGEEIRYQLGEVKIDDYKRSISANTGIITNTYSPDKINVYVSKEWADNYDQDGMRTPEITAELGIVQSDGNIQWTGKTLPLNLNNSWENVFEDLDQYTDESHETKYIYTVREVKVPDGYRSSVSGSMDTVLTIVNTHTPEVTIVEGRKIWNDNNNEAKARPAFINIRLFADGKEIRNMAVTEKDSWSWKFTDLPKYAAGKKIEYTVSEDVIPGYILTGELQMVGQIENRYAPGYTSVHVVKQWLGKGNQDGIRPKTLTVYLLKDGVRTGDSINLSEDSLWSGFFSNLPVYQEDGITKITYSVEEDVPDGYDSYLTGDATIGFRFVNTHKTETVTFDGEKFWDANGDPEGEALARPKSVTIHLHGNGDLVNTTTISADENGKWYGSFTDLPKYKDGEEISYTWHEEALKNYTPQVDGKTITNVYTPGKTFVQVDKDWEDDNNRDGKRPAFVTVYLLADGERVQTVELSEENHWQHTFTDLDIVDPETGKDYVYDVEEEPIENGLYQSYKTGSMETGFTIENTYTPETITISGSKTWVYETAPEGAMPESIIVRLRADGEIVDWREVKEEDNWSWTFENMPRYARHGHGNEIVYTITEDSFDNNQIDNYMVTYDGFDITNTYDEGYTSFSVSKNWNDAFNIDGGRPNAAYVQVYADGLKYGEPVELNEENKWFHQFNHMPIYREETDNETGETLKSRVIYTVEEVDVPDIYVSSVVGSQGRGFTLINTHESELVNIYVTKKWDDNGNSAGKRPGYVEVGLKTDGDEAVRWEAMTEYTDWTGEYLNLPKYRADGSVIQYSLEEILVDGYENPAITGSAEEGFVVTNTLKPDEPEPTVEPTPEEPEHWEWFLLDNELPQTGLTGSVAPLRSEKPASVNYQPVNMELQIPSLNITSEIVTVPRTNEGYPVQWLGCDAGLLEGTALPGEGTAVIAAHNTLNAEEYGPFAAIQLLQAGDRFFVRSDHGMLIYEVYANEKIGAYDGESLVRIAKTYDNTLTLLTCEDERPEGGYASRRIVAAKNVK